MRLSIRLTAEQIAEERRRRYLAAWPMHAQLEAQHDAANGRPEKLERMTTDFARIKAELPFPD